MAASSSTRCGDRFTHGKNGEPYFSALRGFALPAGWGIEEDVYVRADGAIVFQFRDGLWYRAANGTGYETPLEAMQAADEASW